MSKLFVISDTHFYHESMINKLKTGAGEYVRARFYDIEEMNETIIKNWNTAITKDDTVIHLGDFAFDHVSEQEVIDVFKRLNGRKKILIGNHDETFFELFLELFDSVRLYRKDSFLNVKYELSHLPIHQDSFYYDSSIFNVHGHTHNNLINSINHINVCVELTDYFPVLVDNLQKVWLDQQFALVNHDFRVDLAYQDLKGKNYARKL